MEQFKDVIELFRKFSDKHTQVNYFDWGNVYELNIDNFIYTTIYANPLKSNVYGNIIEYNFDIYILDLLEEDESNMLDILNNTNLIGNDLITYLYDKGVSYEDDIIITPFTGKWDQLLCGWIFNIKINIDAGTCDIPIN